MKKLLFGFILFVGLLFGIKSACAQARAGLKQPALSKTDSLKKDSVYKSLFNRRGKVIYFEAAGPGTIYSINYDVRFNKRQNGLGVRAGASYFYNGFDKLITVPIMLNYLHGKKGHYLELAAGATFFHNYSVEDIYFISDNSESNPHPVDYEPKLHSQNGVLGNVTIGYRYQPLKGGFNFRVGGGPIASTKKHFLFWPYMSFGYAFKNKVKAKK